MAAGTSLTRVEWGCEEGEVIGKIQIQTLSFSKREGSGYSLLSLGPPPAQYRLLRVYFTIAITFEFY